MGIVQDSENNRFEIDMFINFICPLPMNQLIKKKRQKYLKV